MNILFWGTPAFAVPSLVALDEEGHEVVGVVTQPDRPAGRGRHLRPSPVKEVAEAAGYPLFQPDRPRGAEFIESLRALKPDISVVVAYGHILSREVLDIPPLGSINVHASLLPHLRGAAPINWAIARGYETTGVTIMRMVEAMDAGPILFQNPEPILEGETASELALRLSEVGAETLIATLTILQVGAVEEREQDHEQATYAPKVDRTVARVDWDRPAKAVSDHIRGMDAVPGAWTEWNGQPLKLFEPTGVPGDGAPGTILAADAGAGLVVATREGAVRVGQVQPPGKRRMATDEWLRGRAAEVGQRFE